MPELPWKDEVSKIASLCARLYVESSCHVTTSNPFAHTEYKDFFDQEREGWTQYWAERERIENEGTEDDLQHISL
jgi:hypothetical protein